MFGGHPSLWGDTPSASPSFDSRLDVASWQLRWCTESSSSCPLCGRRPDQACQADGQAGILSFSSFFLFGGGGFELTPKEQAAFQLFKTDRQLFHFGLILVVVPQG